MMSRMLWKRITVSLTDSASTTPAIDFRQAAGGFIRVIGDPTTLTFYGAADMDETFVPLHDADNAAVALTVTQAKGYAFPAECFACGAIKIVAGAATTADISLKG